MKNIYVMKGWFIMEQFKNGAISEEALDEIAGGFNISPSVVKKALIAAGVGILAAGVGVGGTIGIKKYNKSKSPKETPKGTPREKKPTVGEVMNNVVMNPDVHEELFGFGKDD